MLDPPMIQLYVNLLLLLNSCQLKTILRRPNSGTTLCIFAIIDVKLPNTNDKLVLQCLPGVAKIHQFSINSKT